jgi:hypothetical protein
VEVKFDDFETLSEDVEVTMETEYLYGSLLATGEAGKQYANEHMSDFLAVEGVAGYLANKEGEAMRKKLLGEAPVVASLPVKNSLFLITYTQDEEQKVKITISALNTYMDEAVKKFKSLLSKDEYLHQYDVEFLGYDNLLAGTFIDNDESDPVEYLKKGFSGIGSFNIVTTSECGNYICAKMTTGREKTYTLMTYKAIIGKNTDGKWEILGGPLPFLTKFNTDGIADEMLVFANEL